MVTRGCFPDGAGGREKRTVDLRPDQLPTLGPLWPCPAEAGHLKQFVRYVASRTNPRRFVLHINDRAALIKAFTSCVSPDPVIRYRLDRWSSIVTVSADGQRVRQREVLWDSILFDGVHGWARERTTASFHGRRTGDVTTTDSVGEDTGGIPD